MIRIRGLAKRFGSVEVPYVHNSPGMTTNVITPVSCDVTVTNRAVVTATVQSSGETLTAEGSASVFIGTGSGHGGSGVTASATKVKDRVLSVDLTNHGSTSVTLSQVSLAWPSANQRLVKVQLEGATIFDVKTSGTSAVITSWKGSAKDREIRGGETLTLKLQFEADAETDVSLYGVSCDFGGGLVDFLP